MNNLEEIQQIFVNNLGNKITVELANGMLQEIIKLIPQVKLVDNIEDK